MSSRRFLRPAGHAFAAAAVLLICYFVLDRPLARLAGRIPVGSNPAYRMAGELLGVWSFAVASAVMLVAFWARGTGRRGRSRGPASLVHIPVSVFATLLACEFLKVALARYRPGLLLDADLYGFAFWRAGYWYNSFPSGHAAVAFAFFGALAFSHPRWRRWAFAAAGLVAASRVLLNLHYLSDILAGAALGLGLAYFSRRIPVRLRTVTDP